MTAYQALSGLRFSVLSSDAAAWFKDSKEGFDETMHSFWV